MKSDTLVAAASRLHQDGCVRFAVGTADSGLNVQRFYCNGCHSIVSMCVKPLEVVSRGLIVAPDLSCLSSGCLLLLSG